MAKRLYARYNGVDNDAEWNEFREAEKKGDLMVGELYVVEKVYMGRYQTEIKLQGINHLFNSVRFDFAVMKNGQLTAHHIQNDKDYNPYL